jgi:hypothetical protein
MPRVFQQIVGLGPDCRTIHQIRERFGRVSGRRGVFDWQGTPPAAVIEYLRRDFAGMFERDDLQIADGKVSNRRFGTSYKHLFPDGATEEVVNARYPAVRKKHERWCRTTRGLIRNGLSTLFVLGLPVASRDMDEMSVLLENAAPGRDFLLLAPPDGDSRDDWRGNYDLWRRHFSRFSIEPPLGRRINLKFYRLGKRMFFRYSDPLDADELIGMLNRLWKKP